MQSVQLKLREASKVLGVAPKELQNLVQFGVLQPKRQNRFFVFDTSTLLEAKVALYLKESLGTSVPLLARFTKAIFKDVRKSKPGRYSNISILSRPIRGKEGIKIEIPLRALAKELEVQLPLLSDPGARKSKGWKEEITSTFAEIADDLSGVTEREILDEIAHYRAGRKKTPEITIVALSKEKTA